jgi:predicted tellurium resistance membrane protein TerC
MLFRSGNAAPGGGATRSPLETAGDIGQAVRRGSNPAPSRIREENFRIIPSRVALTAGGGRGFFGGTMDWLTDPQIWISLFTLTALEIVLGIDNIIFISILAGKLPAELQAKARQLGLMLALITRVLLLMSLTWIMGLTQPLFTLPVMQQPISGRDLVLLLGGLFLIWKSVKEVHEKLEAADGHVTAGHRRVSFAGTIVQILLLDIVFSLDSVITAVGMADNIWVMVAAVVIALGVMLKFAGAISDFVNHHPTLKMLALSFLILIGVTLVGEGLGQHIPKGYIYFSMAFAFGVEMLNLRLRKKQAPQPVVELHQPYR